MADVFSLTLKDKGKLLANLLRRDQKFIKKVRTGFILGGDEFIQLIRSRWYSGRRSDDSGLNRRTSLLYNTWRSEVKQEGVDVIANITNGTHYARIHETGSLKRNIPKRTDVAKDLKDEKGKTIFVNAVRAALREAF